VPIILFALLGWEEVFCGARDAIRRSIKAWGILECTFAFVVGLERLKFV
jgi:hypothetical protein